MNNGRSLPDGLKILTNHSGFRSYMDNLVSLQGTLRGISWGESIERARSEFPIRSICWTSYTPT